MLRQPFNLSSYSRGKQLAGGTFTSGHEIKVVREEVHEMVKRVGKQRKHASAAQNPFSFSYFP